MKFNSLKAPLLILTFMEITDVEKHTLLGNLPKF